MSETQTYYAKIENNIVIDVHVVTWDFIVTHPERYGNPDLWLQVFPDGSGRGYPGVGWTYNAELDQFVAPVPEVE